MKEAELISGDEENAATDVNLNPSTKQEVRPISILSYGGKT